MLGFAYLRLKTKNHELYKSLNYVHLRKLDHEVVFSFRWKIVKKNKACFKKAKSFMFFSRNLHSFLVDRNLPLI